MTDPVPHSEEAAEFVLGLLPQDQRRAFAERLARDRTLQEDVLFWEEQLVVFAAEAEPVQPPQRVRDRIEAVIFGAAPAQSWWSSLALWRGLSLASLVAVGGLAFVLSQQPATGPVERQQFVTQVGDAAAEVQVVALYDATREELQVTRSVGGARPGRALELWVIAPGGAPVSLGVLPQAERGTMSVPRDLGLQLSGAVLAISDEPPGGSPTGAPTGDVLATGAIIEI